MRVLLDTDVILDAMLQRAPWHAEADAILMAAAQGQLVCAATPHSLATIFYVGRRIVGANRARADLRVYLRAFEILPINRSILHHADALAGNDFEDNIQIAAAVAASIDAIVTRNVSDYSHSPAPVLTPSELLQRLGKCGAAPLTGQGSPTANP